MCQVIGFMSTTWENVMPSLRSRGAAARTGPAASPSSSDRAQRRVSVGRIAVWCALAAGPAALFLAATSSSPTVPVGSAAPRPTAAQPSADPSGFAEVFVAAWLRSDATGDGEPERAAQAMAPSVALPEPVGDAQRGAVERVSAVRSARQSGGLWSVTVAAQGSGGAVRYFSVPVPANRDLTEFVVRDAPAQVAAPVTGEVPVSADGKSAAEYAKSSTWERAEATSSSSMQARRRGDALHKVRQ